MENKRKIVEKIGIDKEKINIAINLLKNNVDISIIISSTELGGEEIKGLKDSL